MLRPVYVVNRRRGAGSCARYAAGRCGVSKLASRIVSTEPSRRPTSARRRIGQPLSAFTMSVSPARHPPLVVDLWVQTVSFLALAIGELSSFVNIDSGPCGSGQGGPPWPGLRGGERLDRRQLADAIRGVTGVRLEAEAARDRHEQVRIEGLRHPANQVVVAPEAEVFFAVARLDLAERRSL